MGRSMQPIFGTGAVTTAVRGFAGKNKANVGLVVQSIPNTEKYYLSIVNDRGSHVSSYTITQRKLRKMIADDFWILKQQNFN